MTAANLIQMLLCNLGCDGTQLHAPSPRRFVAHELLVIVGGKLVKYTHFILSLYRLSFCINNLTAKHDF